MRVSSLYNSTAMLDQMNRNSMEINNLMQQMSTQKRINLPSDDPIGASRMVQLNREQSALAQYQSNIERVSNTLAVQESYVNAVSDQLLGLNDVLLSAANGTHSTEDMAGYGAQLEAMVDSLVASLNAQNENGSYIFSGTKTDTKPVQWDEDTQQYIYAGNDNTRQTTVANGVDITENTLLAQAFSSSGDDLAVLNQLKSLSVKMQDPSIPQEEYQAEINTVLESTQQASDKIAAIYTDLGGRQNRLTMLSNSHTDVSIANDQVIRDISETDWATTSMNLQLYINSVQITNKAYSMVSDLSLFSVI